ncbi:Uncharacterised protein [Mycobacteroides abscessus subsp. abscessus]|nr:Uncharacterised protein [Mycobacteroides abscessus subsp. abscessus]
MSPPSARVPTNSAGASANSTADSALKSTTSCGLIRTPAAAGSTRNTPVAPETVAGTRMRAARSA